MCGEVEEMAQLLRMTLEIMLKTLRMMVMNLLEFESSVKGRDGHHRHG